MRGYIAYARFVIFSTFLIIFKGRIANGIY